MSTTLSERREHIVARGGLHRLFLIVRLVLTALSLSLLPACSALPTPVVRGDQDSFKGMSALVSNETPARPLHVLIVHGMGTTSSNQFDGFILALANRLRLVQIPDVQHFGCRRFSPAPSGLIDPTPTPISITGVPPDASAQLYTYTFASTADDSCAPTPVLVVSFLLWAPLTQKVKSTALGEDGAPPRQEFANLAKGFIDDYLADVVLYGGAYRDNVLRPSIQAALCYVTGGSPSPDGKTCRPGSYNDPTVIITHSLGGYMFMDALDDELHREDCSKALGKSPALQILENTNFIYMMANQLALLDLTRLKQYPHRLGGPAAVDNLTQRFAKCWASAPLKSPPISAQSGPEETASAKRQIVAFSDPNDILSWLVEPPNLKLPRPEWHSVELTNVYQSNGEFSIPLLFSTPTTAHTGYFDNQTVMELLVCGMNKGAVNACLPNGLR